MISREEILNLAQLARLELKDDEIASLQNDISSILDYVGQISAVSTQDDALTPGLSKMQPLALRNVMRGDAPRTADDALAGKEESLRAAFPKREGGFNIVRKIITKDE